MRLDLSPLLDHPLGDRLHDKVMAHIALRVIRATNKDSAAENLTEATLCRRLNVSRTVVREAVRVLAAKGLVEVRQKAGIRGLQGATGTSPIPMYSDGFVRPG